MRPRRHCIVLRHEEVTRVERTHPLRGACSAAVRQEGQGRKRAQRGRRRRRFGRGISEGGHTKALLVTDGAVLLKTLPFGIRNPLGSLRSGATPSTTAIELFDLRGVRAIPNSDLVILVYSAVDDKKSGSEAVSFVGVNAMGYALYQSPDLRTSIESITSSLVAAYAGVPR